MSTKMFVDVMQRVSKHAISIKIIVTIGLLVVLLK